MLDTERSQGFADGELNEAMKSDRANTRCRRARSVVWCSRSWQTPRIARSQKHKRSEKRNYQKIGAPKCKHAIIAD